jgi:hypothetical protein
MKSISLLILILGYTSASSINVFKTSKFEIPPTTTRTTVKEEPNQFKPSMHLNTDKLLSYNGNCIVVNQLSVIENHDIYDCESAYIPLRTFYTKNENKSHVLPDFLSVSDILEPKQYKTGICRKIRR